MTANELKKKVRQLKKQEIAKRSVYGLVPKHLIWHTYFSDKALVDLSVTYDLQKLLTMDHMNRKDIFEAFFLAVYIQHYKENGFSIASTYDATLLAKLNLPATATIDDIKSRFRELAQKHHPDKGGNPKIFMDLLAAYEGLKSNN